MTPKSPFLVFQDLFTPEECNSFAETVKVQTLVDDQGVPQASERYYTEVEAKIFPKIKKLVPKLEGHYPKFKYRGTEKMIFQQFPVTNGKVAEDDHCESSVYKRKKWLRVNDRALTGVLWLKDYQESPPFDLNTQVLGGKLEFQTYNFGFQPQRGTLVIYPANERFISRTTAILVGELQCVRINICAEGLWMSEPNDYPGDFRVWFSNIV